MHELLERTRPVVSADGVAARLESAALGFARRLATLELTGDDDVSLSVWAFLATGSDGVAATEDAMPNGNGHGSASHAATDPLDRLVTRLRLAPVERDLLLVAALPELHESLAAALRRLHPLGLPAATAALAVRLLCASTAERRMLAATLAAGAAVRAGAMRVDHDAPWPERTLRLAPELWSALLGHDGWPAALEPVPSNGPDGMETLGLERWLESASARRACRALDAGMTCTVLVSADDDELALRRAIALVARSGERGVAFAPSGPQSALEAAMAALVPLSIARDVVPVLRLRPAADGQPPVEAPRLTQLGGPVIFAVREGTVMVRGPRPVLPVPVERLTVAERRTVWRTLAPELSRDAAQLAARYTVEPGVAALALGDARRLASLDQRALALDDVAAGMRARTAPASSGGVALVRPQATWDRLVLAPDRLAQLHEARERLLRQATVLDDWGFLEGRVGARGVRMLFAGPPGTGKTLAAEVLARALGVDLLVVDVSRTVSKWIGETEKNLAAVFDAADGAQSVLLFDEADALFGKRTEVGDARDRYANLEVAYLLTRLERFEGLAILSTNLRQNVDPAFVRRLEFVIEFDEPAVAEREEIWRCHVPSTDLLAPDVDLGELAALYPIAGGTIRNAAVAAGFLAATAGTPITRHHLVRALRREYEKLGRPFPGAPAGMAVP